jgi:VanZ family protein
LAFLPDYNDLPPIVSFSDLINHGLAFFVLYLLLERAFPEGAVWHYWIALSLYAAFIELVQYFLPTRYASVEDIAADMTGMLLAAIILPHLPRIPLLNVFYRH